ncbi:MAG: hypothetical protein DYH08_14985 [Actinobacteria bacterium ATB1]|nr:hypothetical protein [Actinobacteria bacterium ATB1]
MHSETPARIETIETTARSVDDVTSFTSDPVSRGDGPEESGPNGHDPRSAGTGDGREARRIVRNFAIFMTVNLLVLAVVVGVCARVGNRNRYPIGDTQALLNLIPYDEEFDYVFAGPSHGRQFSWDGNHEYLEAALGADVMNISRDASGPYVYDVYTDLFLGRGNSAKAVVFVVHPFAFYGERFNESNKQFVNTEPLQADFLRLLVERGVPAETIASYVQSKVSPKWVQAKPEHGAADHRVEERDQALVDRNLNELYPEGASPELYARYSAQFADTVEELTDAGIPVLLLIPPTLIAEDAPGLEAHRAFLAGLAEAEDVDLLDLTSDVMEPSFYQDMSHLNRWGVEYVAEKYLRPSLERLEAEAEKSGEN